MRMCPLCVSVASVALGAGAAGWLLSAGPAPAAVAPIAADAFAVDPVHSGVVYSIKHMGAANFHGMFHSPTGTFAFDPAKPEAASLDVTIKLDALVSNDAKRDQHLKSADFFSAKEFPTITFKSTSAKASGDKSAEVSGDLTLRGVTKPVTARVTHTGTGEGRGGKKLAGVEATFTIKRSDFGMNYMVGPLGDDVTLTVFLEGSK